MPGDSGVLVVTRVRSTTTKCTRGRGCNGHPAFPTPSFGRELPAQPGRIAPRDRECASEIRTPSLRANGSRECAPDDRLREAIHSVFLATLWNLRFAMMVQNPLLPGCLKI